jgi:hypothetical protein
LLSVPLTPKVLDGPELGTTRISMPLNVTHTIVGVMLSDGQSLSSSASSGSVVNVKTALPPSTFTVCWSLTEVVVLCRPLGSLLPEGVMQPVVTLASASKNAVAVSAPPRPDTSATHHS